MLQRTPWLRTYPRPASRGAFSGLFYMKPQGWKVSLAQACQAPLPHPVDKPARGSAYLNRHGAMAHLRKIVYAVMLDAMVGGYDDQIVVPRTQTRTH